MEDKTQAVFADLNEVNRERNQRYVYAKLPFASSKELALIAGFIRGLHIDGWDNGECHCTMPMGVETV